MKVTIELELVPCPTHGWCLAPRVKAIEAHKDEHVPGKDEAAGSNPAGGSIMDGPGPGGMGAIPGARPHHFVADSRPGWQNTCCLCGYSIGGPTHLPR